MSNTDWKVLLTTIIDQASLNSTITDAQKKLLNKKLYLDIDAKMASQNQIDTKIAQLNDQLRKNSAYTKSAKAELQGFISELSKGDVAASRLKDITTQAKVLHSQMAQLNKIGFSFGDSIKNQASKFAQWVGVSSVVMTSVQAVKKMYDNVYELDTAMTDLYKVTDETDDKYSEFLDSANEKAQELGRSVSSLVEQTATWAKLGYNINESAELAETSSVYANVGEVDDDTSVSDIVTAMKSFNITAEDSITIVDKLNEVSNTYATSAADLGTGLSNSASALSLAGNDIDQSIAMITAMTEITQDTSESGNALKVLSMRLRGASTELVAAGENTDGMAESTSKLEEKIKALTNVDGSGGFDIMSDPDTFKSTYEIMQGIAEVWDDMSDIDQASLLEIIAGKQRGNSISALLTNMSQAENVLATSTNSAGSAMEEQERWLESMEAKIQQFDAAFQTLSSDVLDSDFLKGLIDSGTTIINVLDTIIDKFGVLPTLITGISAGLSSQNIGNREMFRFVNMPNIECVLLGY